MSITFAPNLKDLKELRYIKSLGSLDKTMSECYKLGLLQEDKLKYKDSEVTVIVARIIKDLKKSMNESIELRDNKVIIDEKVNKSVNEKLRTINDLMMPYYD